VLELVLETVVEVDELLVLTTDELEDEFVMAPYL